MSTAGASTNRRPSQRSRAAAASLASAITRSAARYGTRSCDTISNASAVNAAALWAAQTTGARLRFQAKANAATTNALSNPAVAEADKIWKRSVSSPSMGARISAAVTAYAVLAKRAPAGTRVAHTNHVPAYASASTTTANLGNDPDSATARSTYAPAIPSMALPTTGNMPPAEGRSRWSP